MFTVLNQSGAFFWPALVAFLSCFALCRLALHFFPRFGLMDRPKKYGLSRAPIPYYGGLVLFVSFLIGIVFFVPFDARVFGFLVGLSLVVGVSFFDDLIGLSPWLRLFVQVFAALVAFFSGAQIHSLNLPFLSSFSFDLWVLDFEIFNAFLSVSVLSAVFTVCWLVLIINSVNFIDGLNGLPSGVAFISALTLFFLSIRGDLHVIDQTQVALMALILAMVCLSFWLFDFYPAKILMGDTGSMMLGYLLGGLAIFSGGKVATLFLVLGVPLLDALWVVVRRVLIDKKSPMIGDRKHFHHRLLDAGLTDHQALFLIYGICAIFGFLAVNLQSQSKLFALVALIFLMLLLGAWVVWKASKRQKSF
jgi:UDP-GlcNAc:undecaprenyl-phosphate GlcNAc-1-phosphate transferase